MSEIITPAKTARTKAPKAGVILHGMANDRDGFSKLHVLSSYSEGRFSERDKCYCIPQGSIDAGETTLTAALRETYEETGIDIRKMMGEKSLQQLERGETVTNVESSEYPGVKIIRATPPKEHHFLSGKGTRQVGHFFNIEVEGIERLKPSLKMLDHQECSIGAQVRIPTQMHVIDQQLPSFDEILKILRTGIMPAWGGRPEEVIIKNPVFPTLEANYHPSGLIKTKNELSHFCHPILPGGDTYRALLADLESIQKHFAARGFVGDDGAKLKLDIRDRPLTFYQEGGEILPVGLMIERSAKVARKNPLYANMMWGDYIGARRPEADELTRLQTAQIYPLIELVRDIAPMEVVAASWSGSDREALSLKKGSQAFTPGEYIKRALAAMGSPAQKQR
ncbi:MAG: NUDIX domain-containing protein [Rickettsiales bacterium]